MKYLITKVSDETRYVYTKSNNTKIMVGSETDEIIKELLKSISQWYQEGLEESMKESKFNFDSVNLCITILKNKSEKNRIITYRLSRMIKKIENRTKKYKIQ